MKLEDWYGLHDDFEVLLRKLERLGISQNLVGTGVWASHDELERVIIKEQPKFTEEELDKHE